MQSRKAVVVLMFTGPREAYWEMGGTVSRPQHHDYAKLFLETPPERAYMPPEYVSKTLPAMRWNVDGRITLNDGVWMVFGPFDSLEDAENWQPPYSSIRCRIDFLERDAAELGLLQPILYSDG